MNPEFEIRITEDGSPTIYSKMFDATYHSQKGAMQESVHVFIQNGLIPALEKFNDLKILEIGFGTGLNAILTLEQTKKNSIYYHAVEKFPLPEVIYKGLNYGNDQLLKLHQADWNCDIEFTPRFTFHKANSGIEVLKLNRDYNLIYMDAFAPSTQDELWQKDILEKLYDCLVKGGILVTFCAKGQFKRDLKSLGFTIESPVGASGKREMTRATK
jgi:tRNA U34 5-methylaminomethyl-2-thiouridine-forming methyltransferase MnmC